LYIAHCGRGERERGREGERFYSAILAAIEERSGLVQKKNEKKKFC